RRAARGGRAPSGARPARSRRRLRRRYLDRGGLTALQRVHGGVPLALEIDRLRGLELELVSQPAIGRDIDLNHPRYAFGGDAARGVDGLAPEVVDEFLLTDHPCDHRAGACLPPPLASMGAHPPR